MFSNLTQFESAQSSADNIYGELFKSGKDDNYKVVLKSDGSVFYSTAGTSSTLCNLDMTYFPFDLQMCFIHIESWTYSIKQMKIRKTMNKINVSSFRQNGIWDLLDTNVGWQLLFVLIIIIIAELIKRQIVARSSVG